MNPQRIVRGIRASILIAGLLVLAGCGGDPPDSAEHAEPAIDGSELHAAAREGDVAAARHLIEGGVPVDAGDRYDNTALMMASDRGHVEMVRYLLEAGADVNHRETFFNTSAFDLATWRERGEVALVLLAAGADQREEAIELAIREEQLELLQAAVAAGPLRESFVENIRGRDELSPEYLELIASAAVRPDPAPPAYGPDELRSFEGRYETWDAEADQELQVDVTATANGLTLGISERDPVEVVAFAEREFRSEDGGVEASFWGRLGSIESITLRQGDQRPVRMRHSIAEPLGAEAFTPNSDGATVSDNWPQFRGTAAAGAGNGKNVPDRWDVESGEGIRWNRPLPGLGNSSPVVWGDLVIVTTAVAEGAAQEIRTGLTGAGDPVDEAVDHSWRVLAYDKSTGEPRWETEVGRGVPLTQRHFKATQANSTPATDGTYLVVVFPTAGIACLDLTGKLKWKHELGGMNASSPNDPGVEWGYASSPIIHDGAAILLVDTYEKPYIVAWDLETGDERWRTDRDGPPSWSTPTVAEGELVVNGATIRGYDPATGEELWSLGPNSELVIATPIVGDGVVYVSAGYAPVKPIYAVKLGTRGRLEVEPGTEHDGLAWSHARGGAYMPTPLLLDGLLYVVHHNGRMVTYDAASGAPIYKTRFSEGGTFTASPVAAEGKLYISTEEGQIYVVEAGPEYRELAVNGMGEPVMATPAFSAGTMYVRTPGHLVAIGG